MLDKIKRLGELAVRQHIANDEDSWYSCPAAPGGCSDDRQPAGVCTCGADTHNKKVAELLAQLCESPVPIVPWVDYGRSRQG